MNVVLVLTAVS